MANSAIGKRERISGSVEDLCHVNPHLSVSESIDRIIAEKY
jgi:hypothetical protein